MTPDEAYRKGQADMRRRIEKQWNGWCTNSLGGLAKAHLVGRRSYGNVPILIRRSNKVRPLSAG